MQDLYCTSGRFTVIAAVTLTLPQEMVQFTVSTIISQFQGLFMHSLKKKHAQPHSHIVEAMHITKSKEVHTKKSGEAFRNVFLDETNLKPLSLFLSIFFSFLI